ncbi:MAG: HAMP domain-containing sensor histidine kinase [Pseudomonadota bacterium]
MQDLTRTRRHHRRSTYVLFGAVAIIAVTLLANYYIIINAIDRTRVNTPLLTAGAEHAIMTERIALLGTRVAATQDPDARLDVLIKMDAAVARAWAAHGAIISKRAHMSAPVAALYFDGQRGIDSVVGRYLKLADQIVRSRAATQAQLRELNALEIDLLRGLERSLSLHKAETVRELDQAFRLKSWVFAATIAVMFLVVAFILVPVLRRSSKLMEETDAVQSALEKERNLTAKQRRFVALVSHEFRTPMTVIRGRADQLSRKADTLSGDKIRRAGQQIVRSVDRLVLLIETVLDSSRLEDGSVTANMTLTDISPLLEELHLSTIEAYPEHDIALIVAPHLGPIECDPVLLGQAVSNLLNNACTYSAPGTKVSICARLSQASGHVLIEVADTGVGIPRDELPELFNRFFRASTAQGRPGTGIGLHVAQRFVELQGGEISVQSAVGSGSTFTVTLPLRSTLAVAAE